MMIIHPEKFLNGRNLLCFPGYFAAERARYVMKAVIPKVIKSSRIKLFKAFSLFTKHSIAYVV